jgi:hypothetical protein
VHGQRMDRPVVEGGLDDPDITSNTRIGMMYWLSAPRESCGQGNAQRLLNMAKEAGHLGTLSK